MEIALVYMVAGMSSRFGGKIKQFVKVTDNETLIEHSLNQAIPAGFTKIIFVVGEKTEKPFKKMFGKSYKGIPVYYAFQHYDKEIRDKPWGTTDALCSVKDIADCPFVVCNGDDIYGKDVFKILVEHLKTKENEATVGYKLIEVLSEQGGVNRGIFELNSDNTVKSITEIFDINLDNLKEKNVNEDNLCSMNIFAFYPKILDFLEEVLVNFKKEYKDSKEAECLLPTEITNLIKQGKLIMHIYPTNEKWFGITRLGDEIKIRKLLKI